MLNPYMPSRSFVCRSPAHCIEYAHLIQWDAERAGEAFDADIEEHLRWVFDKAAARAAHYGIQASTCLPVRNAPFLSSLTFKLCDADIGEHLRWAFDKAAARGAHYSIQASTSSSTIMSAVSGLLLCCKLCIRLRGKCM